MKFNDMNKLIVTLALCLATTMTTQAFDASRYASHSRLSSGYWVKISVATDGMYQITAEELQQMGFSRPENVQVYGFGGHIISEKLDGSVPDDLQPVSTTYTNGKLIFYGCGPASLTYNTSMSSFTRTLNAYSTLGYYLLSETDQPVRVTQGALASNAAERRSTNKHYFYHEKELMTISRTGKDLLGEDICLAPVTYDYHLPDIADSTVVLLTRAAAKTVTAPNSPSAATSTIVADFTVDGQRKSVPYTLSEARIYASDNGQHYRTTMCSHEVTLPALSSDGSLSVSLVAPVTILNGRLDYNIITYDRHNTLPAGASQVPMCFTNLTPTQAIELSGMPSTVQLWNVNNPASPVNCRLQTAGSLLLAKPGLSSSVTNMVAFDPKQELMSITGYTPIDNQDLHGMPTPDLLIVTIKDFLPQAHRIADLHRDVDGLDVMVVDQQQVFNEFSSGTPDAMAIRLLCKMLYDRNRNKFKNLLMLGAGAYDNRGITFKKNYQLITYESDDSYSDEQSYVSDDFFGILDDNSGNMLERDLLSIGVGRFTSATPSEAQSDVDKLEKYITSADYGVWRNNFFLIADAGDKGLHMFQTEGIGETLENSPAMAMHANKAYVEMFPRATNETAISDESLRTSTEGKRHIIESLNSGQYFMTYVGHAGSSVMTKNARMWRSADVEANEYAHLPIMTTACCNVARYDSNSRGIAEVMFHKPNGGAIALLTSARDVEANNNDMLNQAFVSAMFSLDENGGMLTLGEAYMNAKRSFGRVANVNKMSFFLLGDPAIKVNFPQPNFVITSVNGMPVGEGDIVAVAPMQRMEVMADVITSTGDLDQDFNGDATLSLYDSKNLFGTYTHKVGGNNAWTVTRNVYYERPLLGQVQGRVNNGKFVGELIVPRHVTLQNTPLQLLVYAHRDGTSYMVNGMTENVYLSEFDEELAVVDSVPPVIEKMYLNDETLFEQNPSVPATSTLYINVTDDEGMALQTANAGRGLSLVLDGNKETYYTVKNYTTCGDNGRTMNVAFPLSKLSMGHHTLTFEVSDIAGNVATRTISFMVAQQQDIALQVAERPVIDQATIRVASGSSVSQMTMRVVDPQGRLVCLQENCTMPFVWNLKDLNGNRVKAGLYKVFGTYLNGATYGGTSVADVVVLPERPAGH